MPLMTHPLSQPEIVHGIPGRLRVRVPSLQTSPDLKATLEAQVKATPAVETVRISPATDSIIINYRPQAQGVTQAQIYQLITQITQQFFAPDFNHQSPSEAVASEANGTPQEPTVVLEETANLATTETAPESLIPDPEPAVTTTELTALTDEISSTTATETGSESLIPDPEPAVTTTELTDTELTALTDEISSTATTKITPERVNTPPPAKPSRRTSPRKPRTRKKPEPPANS